MGAMPDNERSRARSSEAAHANKDGMIPTSATGPYYVDELARYLDRLLDEALEETFPASDPIAVPTRRDVEGSKGR
jgi:hypothetical protein